MIEFPLWDTSDGNKIVLDSRCLANTLAALHSYYTKYRCIADKASARGESIYAVAARQLARKLSSRSNLPTIASRIRSIGDLGKAGASNFASSFRGGARGAATWPQNRARRRGETSVAGPVSVLQRDGHSPIILTEWLLVCPISHEVEYSIPVLPSLSGCSAPALARPSARPEPRPTNNRDHFLHAVRPHQPPIARARRAIVNGLTLEEPSRENRERTVRCPCSPRQILMAAHLVFLASWALPSRSPFYARSNSNETTGAPPCAPQLPLSAPIFHYFMRFRRTRQIPRI